MKTNIDFEARSFTDLKKSGAWKYSESDTTEILCLGYSINDAEPQIWIPSQQRPPEDLIRVIQNGSTVHAWNAGFEMAMWSNICVKKYNWPEIPLDKWVDTQAQAAALSYPLSLDNCAEALGIQGKDPKGKRLITKLCRPYKGAFRRYEDFTQDFLDLYSYCQQDVRVEKTIGNMLPQQTYREMEIWRHCVRMNQRGLPMQKVELEALLKQVDEEKERLNHQLTIITKGKVKTANQTQALRKWLNDYEGVHILEKLTKASVSAALKMKLKPLTTTVLKIRQRASLSSTAKIVKALYKLCLDGTIKDNLAYHGAGTGRYAGRGFQLQNLPQPKVPVYNAEKMIQDFVRLDASTLRLMCDPILTASALIRGLIRAPHGMKFLVADYHSIEAIATPWIAGESEVLKSIRQGLDLYKAIAAKMFDVPYDQVSKSQRQAGKICVLAAGFAGGYKAVLSMAENYGMTMADSDARQYIRDFRKARPELVACWYAFERAAKNALEVVPNPTTHLTEYNAVKVEGIPVNIYFYKHGNGLRMKLPSGRDINYPDARLEWTTTPWGANRIAPVYKTLVGGKWVDRTMTGGNYFQNAVQGVCRDLLCDAQLNLERSNPAYPVFISVHDEIGSVVPDTPEYKLKDFINIMTRTAPWAAGMPVTADGYEAKRYRK